MKKTKACWLALGQQLPRRQKNVGADSRGTCLNLSSIRWHLFDVTHMTMNMNNHIAITALYLVILPPSMHLWLSWALLRKVLSPLAVNNRVSIVLVKHTNRKCPKSSLITTRNFPATLLLSKAISPLSWPKVIQELHNFLPSPLALPS